MSTVNLYSKKTIKSGVFLFPVLGTSRYCNFPHKRTYIICRQEKITENSRKLIVSYKKDTTREFVEYERKILTGNKNFEKFIETDDEYLYVFDLGFLKKDWELFLEGKYSKFTSEIKKRIMAYHIIIENNIKKDNRTIQEILYPFNPTLTDIQGKRVEFQDAFERYAPSLGIAPSLLREVGEIYSKPDLKNEELIFGEVEENS